jgi:hypothetical protein
MLAKGGEASHGNLSCCVFIVVLYWGALCSVSAVSDHLRQQPQFDFASLMEAKAKEKTGPPQETTTPKVDERPLSHQNSFDASDYYQLLDKKKGTRPREDRVTLKNRDSSSAVKSKKCGKAGTGGKQAGKSGATSKSRKGLIDHLLPSSWQSYRDILTSDHHDGLSENCSQYVESNNVKWGKGKGSTKHTSGKAKSKGSSSSSSSSSSTKTSNYGKGGSGKGDSEFAVDDNNDDYNDDDDDDDDHYGKGGGKAGAKRPQSSTRVPSPTSPTSAPSSLPLIPSIRPTDLPSAKNPGDTPSANPSSPPRNLSQSLMPLDRPSLSPTTTTTTRPFALPSRFPTIPPSLMSASVPTALPAAIPSIAPTVQTLDASLNPSRVSTLGPSQIPSEEGANSKLSSEPSSTLSLPTQQPMVVSNTPTVKPTATTTTPPPPTARPSVGGGDGTRVVGAPFTLQYVLAPGSTSRPTDFDQTAAATMEYLRTYLETQFAFNPSTTLLDLSYTVLEESDLNASPVSATFAVTLTFKDNGTAPLLGPADVNVLFFTAFSPPSVQQLITKLAGSGGGEFLAQTTGVNIVVP